MKSSKESRGVSLSEKILVVRFGLSNNSIRAGLEQLVKEGWIEKIPRVGN
ncbi:GntR family transcriptional regulator [Paenibacillus hemerocallicola]|uniref:GntR family transcriptional regulator n=1 Tax=Paenibacillus hemerocallicola TaxID=1172614 RepID=A0A5C4SV55_9BACL|nr:GntR family transcriptional regulator [Paenibacillus hemerocallicola]